MSITKTIDVWCDFPGCVDWVHGETGINKVSAASARKSAARESGYVARRIAGGHYDLCPEHRDATIADIEAAREAQQPPAWEPPPGWEPAPDDGRVKIVRIGDVGHD